MPYPYQVAPHHAGPTLRLAARVLRHEPALKVVLDSVACDDGAPPTDHTQRRSN